MVRSRSREGYAVTTAPPHISAEKFADGPSMMVSLLFGWLAETHQCTNDFFFFFFFLISLTDMYSQTCVKSPLKGQKNCGLIRQVVSL